MYVHPPVLPDNKPPKVTSGVFTLVVTTMENVTATYEVEDPDGDDIISIELKVQVLVCVA